MPRKGDVVTASGGKLGHMINEDDVVEVYWPVDKEWYRGTVVSIDKYTGECFIVYEDGDEEHLNMEDEIWRQVLVKDAGKNLSTPISQLVSKVQREKLKVKVKGLEKWRKEDCTKKTSEENIHLSSEDSISLHNKEKKDSACEKRTECRTIGNELPSIVSEVGKHKKQETNLAMRARKKVTVTRKRENEWKFCFECDQTSDGECIGIQNLVWRPCRLHPVEKYRRSMKRVSSK